MSTELITIAADASIDYAAIMLLENHISCLPVLNAQQALAGILTWRDLLKYYVYLD